jgi:DNA-directed RNA polymerase II subunit RPB2
MSSTITSNMIKPKKSGTKGGGTKVAKKSTHNDNNQGDVNNLSTSDIFRFADLHFNKRNYIFRHLYNSYNKFIEEDVKNYLEYGDNVFSESMTATTYYRYRFSFKNIRIQEPTLENGIEPMFPSDARHGNFTYNIKILADTVQYQDVIDIATGERKVNMVGEPEEAVPVALIPLMLQSKWCSLTTHKDADNNECSYDPGGYFIVNGNEKVVICQDRMVENKALVFVKKDSGALSLTVQVNSKSYKPHGITQVVSIKMKKDGNMTIKVPILNEINVFILMRALGLESDRDIINYSVYDEHDIDMVDVAKISLKSCCTDKDVKIQTQQDAIDYLITKLRVLRRYTETDKDVKLMQKKMHLMNLLDNSLLPHVEGGLINKAYYLGYMVNRLLRVHLARAAIDDRDSYINKRIDLPGDLMFELFKQQFKKMLGECKKFFEPKNKDNNTKPINIINYIKPNTVEQGMKASLSTGHWIRRQGVAQMLQRLTYLQTIAFLRRIDAPGGDASTMKLTSPRQLHSSSLSMLCPASTPEHAKVGLTKHLALIASITIMSRDQYYMLKDYLAQKVVSISSVQVRKLREHTCYKVFLNGDWLGMTEEFVGLENEMALMKLKGDFDQRIVSIVADHEEGEIRVYCDSGRLYRPTIRVVNNEIQLKKSHIENISLNKMEHTTKVTEWNEFMMKYPYVVEYVDMELQPYVMIADKIKKVEEMRVKMVESIKKVGDIKSRHVDNRYDDMFFDRYTHCEVHPSLLLAEIPTNVPFCHHDPGNRNIFQYSQGFLAMQHYAWPQQAYVTVKQAVASH